MHWIVVLDIYLMVSGEVFFLTSLTHISLFGCSLFCCFFVLMSFLEHGFESCSCSCSCSCLLVVVVAAFQLLLRIWIGCPTSTSTRRYRFLLFHARIWLFRLLPCLSSVKFNLSICFRAFFETSNTLLLRIIEGSMLEITNFYNIIILFTLSIISLGFPSKGFMPMKMYSLLINLWSSS